MMLSAATLAVVLIVACRARPPLEAPPAAPPPAAGQPPAAPVQGRSFEVIAGESLVQILVFRAGALALAGHNHVIAARGLTGTVLLADDPRRSSVALRIPVAPLSVDEPALRTALGADFQSELPASAREGTRRNMLGPAVLDAERFPYLEIRSERLEPAGRGYEARLRIALRGAAYTIRVPVRHELQGSQLLVTSHFTVRQTDLGLVPFSALLGALKVADELEIRARLVARAR